MVEIKTLLLDSYYGRAYSETFDDSQEDNVVNMHVAAAQ
jgi:hypothetical protein